MPSIQHKFIAGSKLTIQLFCILFVDSGSSLAAPAACSAPAHVVQVASGVFVRPGHPAVVFEGQEIANIGFVVGDLCVAVVDTGASLAEGQALDCAIREVTDLPVCYVFNTHVHPDHMLGNSAFQRPGVEFVAHEKLPRALALRGDIYLERAAAHEGRVLDESIFVFPERTVTGIVELDIGGRVLTVRAHNTAHTDHDLSIIDKSTNTVFLGDLVFLEHLPVIDGSINGWISELDDLSGASFETVIPGHGPVSAPWPSAAGASLQYLSTLRQTVRAWIADGGDLASAQASIDQPDSGDWLLIDHYHRRNVGAAYAELEWED